MNEWWGTCLLILDLEKPFFEWIHLSLIWGIFLMEWMTRLNLNISLKKSMVHYFLPKRERETTTFKFASKIRKKFLNWKKEIGRVDPYRSGAKNKSAGCGRRRSFNRNFTAGRILCIFIHSNSNQWTAHPISYKIIAKKHKDISRHNFYFYF